LLATYQYSDVAPASSFAAIRRMDTASRPSASASSIAVRVISSRLSVGRGPRRARSGRNQMGSGWSGGASAMRFLDRA
jgi:hypothetical protein